VTFSIDWPSLILLYGITLVGAFVAAFVPAWQASRIPPAKAVRHSE
jgi:ABC-type lipoprotein release transport system permease subunit